MLACWRQRCLGKEGELEMERAKDGLVPVPALSRGAGLGTEAVLTSDLFRETLGTSSH